MRKTTFETEIFKTPRDRERGELALALYLDVLFKLDIAYLRDYPDTPGIYQSGVRYKAEPLGFEKWKDIPVIMTDGHGDCEDLACWLAAEMVVRQGENVRPSFEKQPTNTPGFSLYHIVVIGPDGFREDPSKKLGMKGRA